MATSTAERVPTGGRPLREAYGELVWRRPALLRRELVLEAGSERLASLHWDRWYSLDAVAESADGRWHVQRLRSFRAMAGVVVRDAVTGAEVATFQRRWRGTGEVRFTTGAQYGWRFEGFWRRNYSWTDASGTRLVTLRSVGFGGYRHEMSVDPAARSLAELPVLMLLGIYVMALIAARSHSH